ncbi:MAG: putative Hydrogenase/Urease accessory protein HupE/UreJ protein [Hyphomicrobiales bacterium]|nr:putative Hydrogenase/Urease accessory protein HupE/UreJ protein [Hyphomicrobiales bacterium]
MIMYVPKLRCAAIALAFSLLASPAFAHEQAGVAGGLLSGILHPLTGFDHLVAMVAVGIWGAQLGGAAIWVLPITFPLVMALGGVLGIIGVPLPIPEIVIALSALVLGGAVAAQLRVPFWAAAFVVAIFAVFHGHAHGIELPTAANPLAYGAGFVMATGCLHLCGIALGTFSHRPFGQRAIQGLGVVIAAFGVYFLSVSMAAA